MPDALCGGLDQACCSADLACVTNTFCSTATCTRCVTDVALGRHATCVLKYDHTVWCAGDNTFGQLSFGIAGSPRSTWMEARDSTDVVIDDATAVAGGWEQACAVRTGGTVWCWGQNIANEATQVTKTNNMPLTGIVEVHLGYFGACARDINNGVWCWGGNAQGQLGDGTTTSRNQAAPVLVAAMGASFTGALDLHVGGDHVCVRRAGNEIWCWGHDQFGQLGDGMTTDRPTPELVGTALEVALGQYHTCFLHADGTVWCAGADKRNRIGNGVSHENSAPRTYPTPVEVLVAPGGAPFTGAAHLAAGGVSCALAQDTTVYCWGDDDYGETGTGTGTTTPMHVLTVDGSTLSGVERIDAHAALACAYRSDGQVLCWGRNLEGEFGDGTVQNRGFAKPLGFSCP
jgi:alpha-tubulin suppressor-like RCC1 family protein